MRTSTAIFLLANTIVMSLSIGNGGYLYPDTYRYSHGQAAWSSPLTALTGRYFHLTGIQLLSLFSLLTLSYLVWRNTKHDHKKGLIVSTALLLGPWNPALGTAGADALGATIILLAGSRRSIYLPLAILGHLSAGLAGTLALVLRKLVPLPLTIIAAGIAEIVILRLSVFGHSNYPTEIQWRYLIPGIAALTLSSAKLHPKPETPPAANQASLKKPRGANNRGWRGSIAQVLHLNAPKQPPIQVQKSPAIPDHGGRRD
jgi:hypothetical protein